MKKIFFTVTNDLTYDQRMHRICSTLARNGYDITLVGIHRQSSVPLRKEVFNQKRIYCFFKKTKWFYIEYNIRLIFYMLIKKMDAVCAIDLDTILPCLIISKLKNIPRIYDAHELFTGLKEIISRPAIKKKWEKIENRSVPKFKYGYAASQSIVEYFFKRYSVRYETIRNLPTLKSLDTIQAKEKFIIYQGAVNEGRCFESIVPAMQLIDLPLLIFGDGNFMPQLRNLIRVYQMENKIKVMGMLEPFELWKISQQATIGISLTEKEGLNQQFALPNRLFDYVQAAVPQITMNFPEYSKINKQYDIAVLIDDLSPEYIAKSVNNLLFDTVLYNRLKENCLKARLELNWEQEEKKLLAFYKHVFNS